MSLERIIFGSENNSTHKKIFLWVLLLCTVLTLYGIWADFVPSEQWLDYGFLAVVFLSALLISYVLWKKMTSPLKNYDEIEDWSKIVSCISMPFILVIVMWIGLIHGLADIATRFVGSPYVVSGEFSKEYSPSRRQCDYRLTGALLDRALPSYICVSKPTYNNLPEKDVYRIEGKVSIFGVHISGVFYEKK